MTKTYYARSDIEAYYSKLCPEGGHFRKINNLEEYQRDPDRIAPEFGDDRLVVTCAACEPGLMSFVHNVEDRRTGEPKCLGTFTDDPDVMPLTKGEQNAAIKAKEQSATAMAQWTGAMFEQFQKMVASGQIKPEG